MDEHDATLRRRGELPRRSVVEDDAEPSSAGGLPAALAPPDMFGEEPATAHGSPAHDAPDVLEAPSALETPEGAYAERPPHPPGGEIWISASEAEGEGEIGLEGPGDDEGVLPG